MQGATNRSATKSLALFLGITFIITWSLWGGIVLSGENATAPPWGLLLLLGGYGPTAAGFILTRREKGKTGAKHLWSSTFHFRFGAKWYLLVFLLVPVLYACAMLLESLIGGKDPDFSSAQQLLANPVSILPLAFITLISGPLAEEYGWRGYLHDRLCPRFGMIVESLIIGVVWAVWHLPLFYMVGMPPYDTITFWSFALFQILMAFLFTWLFAGTEKSMLAAILFHFMFNFTQRFLSPGLTYRVLLMAPIALVLSIKWLGTNPKNASDSPSESGDP